MANKMRRGEQILTFTDEQRRFCNPADDCVIGRCVDSEENEVIVKGSVESGYEFERGMTYRFFGQWRSYRDTQQWNFTSWVPSIPQTNGAVVHYLQKLCHGIGRTIANRIVKEFESEALSILKDDPGRVADSVKGLSVETASEAAAQLKANESLENCTIELMDLLDGRGFRKGIVSKCIDRWGVRAKEFIERNPYLLMAFRGCGFKLTDKMYLDLGLPPGRLKRQALCAWHASAQSSQVTGNTWNYIGVIEQALNGSISRADVNPEKAMTLCSRAGMLTRMLTDIYDEPDIDGDRVYVAESHAARNEYQVAKRIVDAMHEPGDWPDIEELEGLYDHQKEQLREAMAGGCVGILTGGPGVGKTYATAILMKSLIKKFGRHQIVVGAPTGKAAVRLTEAMAECGMEVTARTWHSILQVINTDPWEFEYNTANPLPCKVMIIDEVSMTDLSMMAKILSARPKQCLVLMVGDVNQLPPVSGGAPFRDFLASGVPQGHLIEVHRNAGKIVDICQSIRNDKTWSVSTDKKTEDNVVLFNAKKDDAIDQIIKALERYGVEFDAVWDSQVLVATNKFRKESNIALQQRFNRNDPVSNTPFRLEDKVINTQNGWMTVVPEFIEEMERAGALFRSGTDEVYVANGDMGRVIACHPNRMVIELSNPFRVVSTGRSQNQKDEDGESSTGCSFELGFAITCHKSQGSGFPLVVVNLDPHGNCDRSWLYTAISRAKKKCVLVGQKSVANKMCGINRINDRRTFLRQTILEMRRNQQ